MLLVLAILLAVAGQGVANAADSSDTAERFNLDPLVVSARGTPSARSQTPGGVGVVTETELFNLQPAGIADAARRIPGVEKSTDSPWGAEINIRGLGRDSVVFLIDGCRVNTSTDINARFGLVAPADIERIEVLKGPISALYGSGSTGGVVNVITKNGALAGQPETRGEAQTSAASNPAGGDLYANLQIDRERWWSFASGSFRNYSSYEGGNGQQIPNSQFEDYQGKIYSGFQWNPQNISEVRFLHMEGRDIGIPGRGLSLPDGPDVTYPHIRQTLASAIHTLRPGMPQWKESALQVYYQQIDRRVRLDDFPGGPVEELRPSADHQTWGGRWQNVFTVPDHTIVAGSEAWWWSIDNTDRVREFRNGTVGIDSSLGNVEQLSGGMFLEDTWKLASSFKLNTGARLDFIRDESDDLYNWTRPPTPATPVLLKRKGQTNQEIGWNAHVGGTWNFSDNWSTTLIGASSYRAPDLLERYKYINLGGGAELHGDPDLDPERSLFFEYGLHFQNKAVKWSGSAYANFLHDLITQEAVSPTVYRLANVDEAVIYGVESDLEYRLNSEWSVYLNAALTIGRNETENDELPFIPPLHGLFGTKYRHPSGFTGQVELDWAADQNQVPSGMEKTPGWVTVNLRVGYSFWLAGLRQELLLGVDNLFDKGYRNALSTSRGVDLQEPGISVVGAWKVYF